MVGGLNLDEETIEYEEDLPKVRMKRLEKELQEIKRKRDRFSLARTISLISSGAITVISFLGIFFYDHPLYNNFIFMTASKELVITVSIISTFLSLLLFIFVFLFGNKLHYFQIEEIQDQIDLLGIEEALYEQRAEKQFKVHQSELKRYYDQSLKQSSLLFFIGVLSLGIGFIIVGVSLYLVYTGPDKDNNTVVAILGGVGGILTNFIGVIYLKMYSETIQSSNEFHNRLVSTNHLHYSNFLISKIKNNRLREETLATLALSISPNVGPNDKKSEDE